MDNGTKWPPQTQQHKPGRHPAQQHGPTTMGQPRAAAAQAKMAPPPPPVYRPQPTPKVLQRKATTVQPPHVGAPKSPAAAQALNRPQPAAKVFQANATASRQPPAPRPAHGALQAKRADARHPREQSRHTPFTPHVPRPESKSVLQTLARTRGAGGHLSPPHKPAQNATAAGGVGARTPAQARPTTPRVMTIQRITGQGLRPETKRPAGGAHPSHGPRQNTIQRQIYWNGVTNQFEINNTRPSWTGTVGALNPGVNQSRNHIIGFEVIQNDLANMLNALVANFSVQNQNRLVGMTEALYNNAPVPEVNTMRNLRTNLLNDISNNTNNYAAGAQALLQALNSSSSNVRLGDSGLNTSIGYSVDAEFNPGTTAYTGITKGMHDLQLRILNNKQVLTLTPHSNAIVYNYQRHSGLALSFVVNGINGAVYPNVPQGQQLSSTQLPTVAPVVANNPYKVLVTDPTATDSPFLFG